MRVSELVRELLSSLPCEPHLQFERDIDVSHPSELSENTEIHDIIGDAVTKACLEAGLQPKGAYAFGEFVAGMITGWSTRYSNEWDVMKLEREFSIGAFKDPHIGLRIYLHNNFDDYRKIIDAIRAGMKEAYDFASTMSTVEAK